MKKAFLLLLVFSSFFAHAQSLKEALFSGKLRNEPGTVIRKGDDLSAKMDTVARKEPARDTLAIITVAQPQQVDSAQKKSVPSDATTSNTTSVTPVAAAPATTEPITTTAPAETAETTAAAEAEPEVKVKPKDNRAIFKDYMTSLAATLKAEVLSNKKIKKGTYYVTIAYTIDTDGQVTITDLVVDPKQEFLQQQIKERMELEMPVLNPELNSSGVARKVNRRYNFSLDKE
jgi:hypothetical protein